MSWERKEKAQLQTWGLDPLHGAKPAVIPESGKVPAVQPITIDNPLSYGRLQHIEYRTVVSLAFYSI